MRQAFGEAVESPEPLAVSIRHKLARWTLLTLDPVLVVAHIAIIYLAFLLAHGVILNRVEVAFHTMGSESPFITHLLNGVKIFSAAGVAVAYGLHTIHALYAHAAVMLSGHVKEEPSPTRARRESGR